MDHHRFSFRILYTAWSILAATTCATSVTTAIADLPKHPRIDRILEEYDRHVEQLETSFLNRDAVWLPEDREWVKRKVAHMYEVDQYMREFALTFSQKVPNATEEEKRYFEFHFGPRWGAVDEKNTADISRLIDFHGWLRISVFGKETDQQAWLLVQHADLHGEFQSRVLTLLEELYPVGETSPQNYAFLYDRVAASFQNDKLRKPQRYGTQGSCVDGKWIPLELEDPENLNARRREVGLPPIEDELPRLNGICKQLEGLNPAQ